MLKVLCYLGDRDSFEYIAASESGRLVTRTQNPFGHIPEIQDLEKVLRAKLDADAPKPEGLVELVESIHQYNETVSAYERVRYVKTLTPQLAQTIKATSAHCDARHTIRSNQNQNTILDMQLKVVKVEKDGE